MRMTTLHKITALTLLFIVSLSFSSCSEKKEANNNVSEASAELIEEPSINGVSRLINEATRYNSLYADEVKASLSEQNPMPNIHQNVDTIGKMYEFDYIWYEKLSPMENLNHEAGMRNVLNEMTKSPQSKNFMMILADEGYGIRFNVEGSISGKKVSNEVSNNEIKDLISLTE